MDQINKAISENVKNGQYFIDARNWYLRSFIYPIIERSFLGVIALLSVIALFQVLFNIYSLFPIKQELAVTIKLKDTLDQIPIIYKIARKEAKPDQTVKEYLLKKYIINRESYNFDNVDLQLNVIKNYSAKYIFKNFYNYISLNNPDSPLLYQRQLSRLINIDSVNFNQDDDNNVIVKFTATDINNINNSRIDTKWIANISYQIQDIKSLIETKDNQSLDFVVTDYKVEQIK